MSKDLTPFMIMAASVHGLARPTSHPSARLSPHRRRPLFFQNTGRAFPQLPTRFEGLAAGLSTARSDRRRRGVDDTIHAPPQQQAAHQGQRHRGPLPGPFTRSRACLT
jgi:hypothetical protein